jgi:hypothetical protein
MAGTASPPQRCRPGVSFDALQSAGCASGAAATTIGIGQIHSFEVSSGHRAIGGAAMKNAYWSWPILIVALSAAAGTAGAQAQQSSSQSTSQTAPKSDSVADAAKRTKEQKKTEPKATHVWNNDNIPKQGEGLNVIGNADQTPARPDDQSSQGQQMTPQVAAAYQSAIQQLKDRVTALSQDLDIAQRKLSLDSDMYYGKTNYQDDKLGKAALDNESADVKAKKDQLAQAQGALAAAQARLAKDQTKQQ